MSCFKGRLHLLLRTFARRFQGNFVVHLNPVNHGVSSSLGAAFRLPSSTPPSEFSIHILLGLAILIASAGNTGAQSYLQLHQFGFSEEAGSAGQSGVIEGSDGRLYGMATAVNSVKSLVFAINKDGSGYEVLRLVDGQNALNSGLLEGSDGYLYGCTQQGGTVFKLNKDGSGFLVLQSLGADTPVGTLIEGKDHLLYGMLLNGVFKMKQDGTRFQVIRRFNHGAPDFEGTLPQGGFVQGDDGFLYGTAERGGLADGGAIFKLDTNGFNYSRLRSFVSGSSDGSHPHAALVKGGDGLLYGTTSQDGNSGAGTIFSIHPTTRAFALVHSFLGPPAGAKQSDSALKLGSDGMLYGVTRFGGIANFGAVFRINKNGTGFMLLRSFDGSEGKSPLGPLVEGSDGLLYAATQYGGDAASGTLFKIARNGSGFEVMRKFVPAGGDGRAPHAGLIQGSDGALYGVTETGGNHDHGTVFKMNEDGTGYTILRHLGTSALDGRAPQGDLIEASDGMLYGTTRAGGVAGLGTVFRLNRDGSAFVTLLSLQGGVSDGDSPLAGLLESRDGMLYGTTELGGSADGGVVFKLHRDGSAYSIIHHFQGADGLNPRAPVLEGRDGALYGTTRRGGSSGMGTVFKLVSNGSGYTHTILRSFVSGTGEANFPRGAGLLQTFDGWLYGMTGLGGTTDRGTIFRIKTNGLEYSVIYNFGDIPTPDGHTYPDGRLLQTSDGRLYGTRPYGGSQNQGYVFTVKPDGSDFTIVQNLGASADDGAQPTGGIIQGRSRALFGTTHNGLGASSFGSIYQLNPIPAPFHQAAIQLPGFTSGGMNWGDFDGDGALDLIATGLTNNFLGRSTRLYRHSGTDLEQVEINLPRLEYSALAWADFDNDGDLDFAISGFDGTNGISKVFRNDTPPGGAPLFTDIHAPLVGVFESALAWGDYDGDGWQDLVVSGTPDGLTPLTMLYHNCRDGHLVPVESNLPDVVGGAFAWSGPDRSHLGLLAVCGYNGVQDLTQVFSSHGDGTFVSLRLSVSFPGVEGGALAWVDFDNDRLFDLSITGLSQFQPLTEIYKQTTTRGGTDFKRVENTGLPALAASTIAWADYDGDSLPDVAISGSTLGGSVPRVTRIYRNEGNGVFADILADLPGLEEGALEWVDYDRDGRPDLAGTGLGDVARKSFLALNATTGSRLLPAAPGNLTAALTIQGMLLSWDDVTSPQHPAGSLTYNVDVTGLPGGPFVVSSASAPDGIRRQSRSGNSGHRNNLLLTRLALPSGIYNWKVQAVDSALRGSAFSVTSTFSIANPEILHTEYTTNGAFRLVFSGSNPGYAIEITTNLLDCHLSRWEPLGLATETGPSIYEYLDVNASTRARGVYRIRMASETEQ